MSGLLYIKVLNGKILKDEQTFGKMDPFVEIHYDNQVIRTNFHEDGHKDPVFN